MVDGHKKRFIAGASCPQCNREDTIYVQIGGDDPSRHCVECDFSEKQSDLDKSSPVGEWSPVRLTDPKEAE